MFIGTRSIILPGSQINENVIIAAGSVVSGVVEKNSVYTGSQAKIIMSISEYYHKRKESILNEKVLFTEKYVDKHKVFPDSLEFKEFFYLFHDRNLNQENAMNAYVKKKTKLFGEILKIQKELMNFMMTLKNYLKLDKL